MNLNSKNITKLTEEISMETKQLSGYPSIDKPWLKYYTEEAINAPLPECTVYELIYNNNKDYLADTAINYYGRKIPFFSLFANIETAAKAFYANGVRKGDIVVVSTANIPEAVYTFYALNRLGAIANMIDPRTDLAGTHRYIKEVNAKLVVCIDAVYPRIAKAIDNTDVKSVVIISPADSLPQPLKTLHRLKNKVAKSVQNAIRWNRFLATGKDAQPEYPAYEKNTTCVIAHTGGTTGVPKGVMLSNDNINAMSHGYRYVGIPFKRRDKFFCDLPPFIMYGLCLGLHATLSYGLEVIVYPIFDSKGFPKQFAKYKPQHFSGGSDHLKHLLSDPHTENMNLSFLITAAVGGDALDTGLEQRANEFLVKHNCHYETVKGYGMTEMSATICTTFQGANAIGSVGIPLVMNNIKIIDIDTNENLSIGQTGEVWFSGPSIMQGYYNMPEENNDRIVIDETGSCWIRTGDLGYVSEDGLVFLVGRIRRIYTTVFENQPAKIFPVAVEEQLKHCADVVECCVVGRLMDGSDIYYEPIAYIVKSASAKDENEIIIALKKIIVANVPTYMQPVKYRFIDELPHTPIGKVDFRKMEEMAKEN